MEQSARVAEYCLAPGAGSILRFAVLQAATSSRPTGAVIAAGRAHGPRSRAARSPRVSVWRCATARPVSAQIGEPTAVLPWCGSPIAFAEWAHESPAQLFLAQARSAGAAPALPGEFEDLMSDPSFMGVDQGCRRITHVIRHDGGGKPPA